MTRIMTYRMADALRAGHPLVLLAEIEHPDGTGYFWTGVGQLEYDGHVWVGAAALGGVSPITYTTELEIQDVAFVISGVLPADAVRLSDSVRGYLGKAWLAVLGTDGNVVSDPIRIALAQFDTQMLSATDQGAVTIAVVGHPAFYNLTRAIDEVWSPEDQKNEFSDDTGMDSIPGLQNKELQWTRT